jgi:hypothetical protein
MAYIRRNSEGSIIAVSETAQSPEDEELSLHSPELIAYLADSTKSDEAKVALSTSDGEFVRVLEDLIATLIEKKVILFTDLPFAAREKISSREKIRGHLNNLENLIGDDEGIL